MCLELGILKLDIYYLISMDLRVRPLVSYVTRYVNAYGELEGISIKHNSKLSATNEFSSLWA